MVTGMIDEGKKSWPRREVYSFARAVAVAAAGVNGDLIGMNNLRKGGQSALVCRNRRRVR